MYELGIEIFSASKIRSKNVGAASAAISDSKCQARAWRSQAIRS